MFESVTGKDTTGLSSCTFSVTENSSFELSINCIYKILTNESFSRERILCKELFRKVNISSKTLRSEFNRTYLTFTVFSVTNLSFPTNITS